MKLLASDYDGTLKFSDSVLDSDIDAIKKWRDQGHVFAIVTGRSKESITRELEHYQIPVDYYITNNGGMVFDGAGTPLLTSTLDTITAIDLMYISHEHPNVVSYVVNDGVHRHKVTVHPNLRDHRYPTLEPDWSEEDIMDSGRFAQLVFSCTTPENALELADQLNHYFSSAITAYANNFVVDIVPKGTSKAGGLEFVESYCEADEDQTYCIGDSYNDIPMLEAFDNSAAAALAPADVRQAAAHEFLSLSDYIDFALEQ